MKTLIKFDKNWADEFDCQSYIIHDGDKESAINHIKEGLQNFGEGDDEWGCEYSFGTNEGWEISEMSIDDFSFVEITGSEEYVLVKLLGTEFGTGFSGF